MTRVTKRVKVVLGLGKIGFKSCLKFVRETYPIKMKDYKFGHVRYKLPNGIILFGSFHPSPRNVNTQRLPGDDGKFFEEAEKGNRLIRLILLLLLMQQSLNAVWLTHEQVTAIRRLD